MATDLRAAVIAAALLLTGCATVTAPAPGLSPDELDAVRQYRTEGLWAGTGLYPDQRPANPPVTVVAIDDWAPAFVKCMNNAGFDNYSAEGGGYTVTGAGSSELERLTTYLCFMSFETEGVYDDIPNRKQLDYLFDYYHDELVPCMAANGYPLDGAPTATEFADQLGVWHPYFAMHDDDQQRLYADTELVAECPPFPPGMKHSGLAERIGLPVLQ